MRISCPNCGAQYEVPDEVIPAEGRDVQCSNCGDTWFQAHPDHIPEQTVEPEPGQSEPKPVPEPDFEPEPDDLPDLEKVPEAAAARVVTQIPVPRKIAPEVVSILRDEAEHEARQRARDSETLESQGDLGLDSLPGDEAGKRSREARDKTTRTRSETATAELVPQDRPRSRLLPDVEEINSTLSASDPSPPSHSAVAFPAAPPAKSGGFARGFGLVVILAIVLVVVYVKAAAISNAVPALAPVVNGYASTVDSARLWLDSKLSVYIPR